MSVKRTSRKLISTQLTQRTGTQRSPLYPPVIPRLSIIICTYNRRNMVLTTLASLRKQTLPYEIFEIIVVDNGSTDGTLPALQTYLQADLHPEKHPAEIWQVQCLQELHNGLTYARLTGLQVARGEIVVFLDDDTIVDPHYLERLLQAYDETDADAIGSCVELRWEIARPYWFTSDLLEMLGYFVPYRTRQPLPVPLVFSGCSFSVKREVLQKLEDVLPVLGKRAQTPFTLDVYYVCLRLRDAGYTLWYEPSAIVHHRITRARADKAFLLGRAYWQGRSEIMLTYLEQSVNQMAESISSTQARNLSWRASWQQLRPDLARFLFLTLVRYPILCLKRAPMHERLRLILDKARLWGRLQQCFSLYNHVPPQTEQSSILLVASLEDGFYGYAPLQMANIFDNRVVCSLPWHWLWQHRSYHQQVMGTIHCYRPGALNLTFWERLPFLARLYCARLLGIKIAATDAGGWWQHTRTANGKIRSWFENRVFACCDLIYTYVRHPETFYQQKKREQIQILSHPGLRNIPEELPAQNQARAQLGLPHDHHFVFFCPCPAHTKKEILLLLGAFARLQSSLLERESTAHYQPLLLLTGQPCDGDPTGQIIQRAALNTAIYLSLDYQSDYLSVYISAIDALVHPYIPHPKAGVLDYAMRCYATRRPIIIPDLPRIKGVAPAHFISSTNGQQLAEETIHNALYEVLLTAEECRADGKLVSQIHKPRVTRPF